VVYFVIKHHKIIKPDLSNLSEPPPPPPPPILFYLNHNFVLIDTFRIFYHKKHIYFSCMNGIDTYNQKPPFINLSPSDLTEIEIDRLPKFLTTINDSVTSDKGYLVSISSPTDTIKNRAFEIITDFLKSRGLIHYNIRNWTEEEEYVTTAKTKNIPYDPKTVDWKIGFDLEFIPPPEMTEEK